MERLFGKLPATAFRIRTFIAGRIMLMWRLSRSRCSVADKNRRANKKKTRMKNESVVFIARTESKTVHIRTALIIKTTGVK